jgi:hypothetical protein
MRSNLRFLLITLLLLLSFNLALPQTTSNYCFQTRWPPSGCIRILVRPAPEGAHWGINVRFEWLGDTAGYCFGGYPDAAALVGNVFTIYTLWGWVVSGPCPEGDWNYWNYYLRPIDSDSLIIRVLFKFSRTDTYEIYEGDPYEESFYIPHTPGPPIPTLSEIGLIIFALLLALAIFWYLYKHKTRIASPQT